MDSKRYEETFYLREYTDGKETYEKMFGIIRNWRNKKKTQKISLYSYQND